MNTSKFVILFFLCHLIGDYIFQSDWQAINKNKKTLNCLVHVVIYTSLFLLLTFSWKALLFIGMTHFIIDRFPVIVKRIIWIKNHLNPKLMYVPFRFCDTTGYYDDSPYNSSKLVGLDKVILEDTQNWGKPRLFVVTIWLYIITDNTLHLTCNFIALNYLCGTN